MSDRTVNILGKKLLIIFKIFNQEILHLMIITLLLILKRKVWLFLKGESNIKDSGLGGLNMDMGYRYGLMELHIRVCGLRAKHQGKASFRMLMEIALMENGNKIKPTVTEYINMRKLEPDMKDTGKTICSMGLAWKPIQKATNIKECLSKVKEMEKESII